MSIPSDDSSTTQFPLLPLRDVVVYPQIVQPLFVGRRKSIKALEIAMASNKQVLLVAQKNASDDEPAADDLYQIGTVATILQLIRLPDGTVKVLVEGLDRAQLRNVSFDADHFRAEILVLNADAVPEKESALLIRSLLSQFEQYVQLSKKIPPEVMTSISSIDEPGRLVDTIANHMTLKLEEKQNLLELVSLQARIEHLMALIESEIDLFQVEKRIRGRVKKQMEKSQREYYLNEQMKAIQKELGDGEEGEGELAELEVKRSADLYICVLGDELQSKGMILARQLREQLAEIDGFISIERFESLATEGKFVSLSYWRDQIAVNQWYNKPAHAAAQSEGRGGIFKDYRIRVAEVFKNYDLSTGRPET